MKERKQILVADDEVNLRRVIAAQLQRDGFDVFTVGDGEAALEALGEHHIDVLITDLRMPKLDGIGLIKAVRKRPGHRFIPIIMLTTESQEEKKREGKAAGASGWVVKPFNPEQLLAVVRMVLQ